MPLRIDLRVGRVAEALGSPMRFSMSRMLVIYIELGAVAIAQLRIQALRIFHHEIEDRLLLLAAELDILLPLAVRASPKRRSNSSRGLGSGATAWSAIARRDCTGKRRSSRSRSCRICGPRRSSVPRVVSA